jgi:hypothetical protein
MRYDRDTRKRKAEQSAAGNRLGVGVFSYFASPVTAPSAPECKRSPNINTSSMSYLRLFICIFCCCIGACVAPPPQPSYSTNPAGTTLYAPTTAGGVQSSDTQQPPSVSAPPSAPRPSYPSPRVTREQAGSPTASGVYVIAHSVSTRMKAREILMNTRLFESSLRQAEGALVVCRSMLFNPLNYSYESVSELSEDADNQLNISGSNYHIYIYSFDDDLRCQQVKHTSFPADD